MLPVKLLQPVVRVETDGGINNLVFDNGDK